MKEIKMWLDLRGEKLLSLFQLVPGPGLEPGRPKTGDFKAVTVSETLHSFLPIWREIGRSCRSEKPTAPYRLDTGSIVLHKNSASACELRYQARKVRLMGLRISAVS